MSSTKLSKKRSCSGKNQAALLTGPSQLYKTRVLRAIDLLTEAAVDDMEYRGDMLGEGVREGLMTSALIILDRLAVECRDEGSSLESRP